MEITKRTRLDKLETATIICLSTALAAMLVSLFAHIMMLVWL